MRRSSRYALVLCFAFLLSGWVRPYLPDDKKPTASHGEKLDFVVLKVGDQRHVVRAEEEIALVYGAQFVVEDAVLRNPEAHVERVNVVGFTHGSWPTDEDRTRRIDTSRDLQDKWSEDGNGQVYAITVASKDRLHGTVYVRILRPELRYAEILVNGKKHVMRDGDPLQLKATDQIKVLKVETNLDSPDGVVFRILKNAAAATKPAGMVNALPTHEIRFLRGDLVFARIPLKVIP